MKVYLALGVLGLLMATAQKSGAQGSALPRLAIEHSEVDQPAREFSLQVGLPMAHKAAECVGLEAFHVSPYPAPGTRVRLTNRSSATLLIAPSLGLTPDWQAPGAQVKFADIDFESTIRFAPSDILAKLPNVVILQLAPNEGIDVIVPPPLANPLSETDMRIHCQSVDAFKQDPRFSYGTVLDYSTTAGTN